MSLKNVRRSHLLRVSHRSMGSSSPRANNSSASCPTKSPRFCCNRPAPVATANYHSVAHDAHSHKSSEALESMHENRKSMNKYHKRTFCKRRSILIAHAAPAERDELRVSPHIQLGVANISNLGRTQRPPQHAQYCTNAERSQVDTRTPLSTHRSLLLLLLLVPLSAAVNSYPI